MMKRDEIVSGLRWLKPESGDFVCEGCGWENSCDARGCRIMREAADMLENDETYDGVLQDAIEKWKKAYGTLREKHSALLEQNGKLRDAAADVTRLAAEAAVERDWISVEDQLPENERPVLTFVGYADNMLGFMTVSTYFAFDPSPHWQWDGLISDRQQRTLFWMPLPEPPKEVEE